MTEPDVTLAGGPAGPDDLDGAAPAEPPKPSAAEVRALLRRHSVRVPAKGTLGEQYYARYRELAGGGGREQTPGRPGGRRGGRASLRGLFGGRGRGTRQRPARQARDRGPRLAAAGVIEHFVSQLAWAARPMPPMQKVLAFESIWAGPVLDEAAKGTVIDRLILQPAARYEEAGKAVNGTLGPPFWTFLITTMGGAKTATVNGQEVVQIDRATGLPVWDDRTRLMVGGLRFSLMSALELSGRSAAQVKERAEEQAHLQDQADELIAWMLQPPQAGPPPSREDIAREAAEHAARFAANARPASPGASQDGDDYPTLVLGSAVMPVPATGAHGGE